MNNQVTFLGTGTSQGVPVILCECEVCTSKNIKDNRTRSSIWIRWNDLDIIVDTGPDFRTQILKHTPPKVDAVLFTHGHKDHVAGLDDIRAYNHKFNKKIDIYADLNTQETLGREFQYVFDDFFKYPGIPELNIHTIQRDTPLKIGNHEIMPIQVLHYKLEVFGFRFGDFTYLTDAKYIPDDQWKYLEGTKTLVLNALRREPHISHFNLKEAIEVAQRVNANQTYFTHISHLLGLHDEVSKELPENIFLAYDGLTIQIE
ncbi:MAG TPA: MBL fold metallo-hydrolase [Chitinophagaceae bacterium]|nr:MBL fold metallo-hydrolase [Chitinophagaceae bacterium]